MTGSETEATLAGLIHEMRHPLLGIKAGLELLALRLGAGATATDEWKMVTAQTARLEELFRTYQGLFTAARGPSVPFRVEPVVERAIELLRFRLDKLGERFSWKPGGSTRAVSGAPQAVIHAVTNLLANGIDALEGSGGRLAVRTLAPGQFVEVRISDEGTGIDAKARERLFAPGFTTKPSGKGTGLGLHLARSAIAAHGGELTLVGDADPDRMPWAHTEFAVRLAVAT